LCLERSERHDTFDEEIFNALVEKIEILTPTHFVFELKAGYLPSMGRNWE